MDFDNTLVAFFDIQGYSSFVRSHDKDSVLKKTKNLFAGILNTAKTDMLGVRFESFALSDSLIITVDTKRHPLFPGSIHFLLATCSTILSESLAISHMPLRGAIGGGWFYQDREVISSSALVEAASFERMQNWLGMVVAPSAEELMINAYKGSQEELMKHNKGFVLKGTVPWKKGYESLESEYMYVKPFEAYFGNQTELVFPSWFDSNSTKVKNSHRLYLDKVE